MEMTVSKPFGRNCPTNENVWQSRQDVMSFSQERVCKGCCTSCIRHLFLSTAQCFCCSSLLSQFFGNVVLSTECKFLAFKWKWVWFSFIFCLTWSTYGFLSLMLNKSTFRHYYTNKSTAVSVLFFQVCIQKLANEAC